ncbi:MAG: histidinol-phosphate transaminase [bacterium]
MLALAAAARKAAGAAFLSAAVFGCGGDSSSGQASQGQEPTPEPGIPAEGYVRLAFNESPFGPPPAAPAAIESLLDRPSAMSGPDTAFLPGINRYPDFLNTALTKLIAARHSLSTRHVVPCCGISELLYMCCRAFLGPGRSLLVREGSFPLPVWYAEQGGCEVRKVPLRGGRAADPEAMLGAVDGTTGLVYIANPDNPEGSLLSAGDLETFVEQVYRRSPQTAVLVDEAYMEYVLREPRPEAIPLVFRYPVLVGRTFSKAWGMAGLRAGYVVGNEELILILNGLLSGYIGGDPGWRMFEGNVNRIAAAAIEGVLNAEGFAFVDSVRERNAALRSYLAGSLAGLGFESLPSEASFLFVPIGSDGEDLRRWLCGRNVLVQAGASFHPAYADRIRVSVGSREELDAFLEALSAYDPSAGRPPSCFRVFYHGI